MDVIARASVRSCLCVAFLGFLHIGFVFCSANPNIKSSGKSDGISHKDGADKANTPVPKCSKLTISLCHQLKLYDHVTFPNHMGHATQVEAQKALRPFQPFLKEPRCRAELQHFLCFLYAPPCSHLWEPVAPCRQACHLARSSCAPIMKRHGFQWPSHLKCSRLPNQGVCLGAANTTQPSTSSVSQTKKTPNKSSNTYTIHSDKNPSKQLSTQSSHRNIPPPPPPEKALQKRVPPPPPSNGKSPPPPQKDCSVPVQRVTPRRYDITEVGDPRYFSGWADVQGQGAANDYCRVIATNPTHRFLSCALAGSKDVHHTYVSMRGFDQGHRGSWFMRDMDGDGKDDYCRCIGRGSSSKISCMKAGAVGFYGSSQQPGSQYSFTVKTSGPCAGKKIHQILGVGV